MHNLPETKKVLVLEESGRLLVARKPLTAPPPSSVIVRIEAVGICGSDVHGAAGDTGRRSSGQVMGHEAAGTIVAVGRDVSESAIGSRVAIFPVVSCGVCEYCLDGREQLCVEMWTLGVRPDVDGAFADFVEVPLRATYELPDGMPTWHGALVEPLAVGFEAVSQGLHDEVTQALVIGGGPIGLACALAAAFYSIPQVALLELNAERRASLQGLGIAQLASTVDELSDLRPSLVVDAVGNSASMATALRAVRPGGTVVLVGMAEPSLTIDAYQVSTGERTIIGSICYSRTQFQTACTWLSGNPGIAPRLVEQMVTMDEGPAAFAALGSGTMPSSKILILPNGAFETAGQS